MSATATRDRAYEQRRQALDIANEVRHRRAELKRRLQSGEVSVAQVLSRRPGETLSWPVRDLLASQHQWGKKRARRLLLRLRIGESRTVRWLTARQARSIVDALEGQQ